MADGTLGLIGGSSLRQPSILTGGEERPIDTPYGRTSGVPVVGRHGPTAVAFLARHGKEHRIPPHRLNHRANLWALKELGATRILATASTGSLKKTIHPGSFVVPHDFISFWNVPTFHDEDVHHATPALDEELRDLLITAVRSVRGSVRGRGIYVQTSGPRLETRAEIAHFATLGDVVGMTMASEATLASELGIPYACLCAVDNFGNGIIERPLSYEQIVATQARNEDVVRSVITAALGALG
ncbi:MAG TPA: MTAP family purine nucleoside phosphorylase [Thermoplasmata archaeon]|nr:MTAP family purine nucleoside phosphorylase [Thermoplasmata archaeon]